MTSEKQQTDVDAVQLMRSLREQIDRETEGMSYDEEKAYIREHTMPGTTESADPTSSAEDVSE